MSKFFNISTDSTLGGNSPSDVTVSSQKAIKTYVDSQTGAAPAFANIVGQPSDNANLATALNAKYDASNPNGYTSNVGTVTSVNNTSPDGNGNVTITIPDPLPSQTGQSGKFLTTDGTDASWNTITIPSVDVDGISINRNTDDELQTIGVINQNDTTTALKVWSGDEADLPAVKDSNTFYATEELGVNLLDTLYPVGSIYITTNVACPLSTLIAGSNWSLISTGIVQAGDIPCKGNGMTLGLTNGNNESGLRYTLSTYPRFQGAQNTIGFDVGVIEDSSSSVFSTDQMIGVTTDSSKSGIIADTSSLTLAVNIFERTA